jgi:hypothetical protein
METCYNNTERSAIVHAQNNYPMIVDDPGL